jgi:hypothetical protein
MIGYVGATLLGWQSGVRSHFWVGIGGVLIIACAVATSLGCGVWLGIPFSATATNVVPFVALGIGIDDMLVIVHEYAALLRREASRPDGRKQYKGDSAPLIGDLLAETGPSVFFTSLTNAIAFATAALAPITIVQLLAQMMVVAIVWNYVFLNLLFIPLVYVDSRRVFAGAAECCGSRASGLCGGSGVGNDGGAAGSAAAKPAALEAGAGPAGDEEQSLSRVLATFMRETYGRALLHGWATKLMVLLFSGGFFVLQLWFLINKSEYGIKYADITVQGSYQHEAYGIIESKFLFYNEYLVQTAPASSSGFSSVAAQVAVQMAAKNYVAPRKVEKSVMGVGTGDSWVSFVAESKPGPDCQHRDRVEVVTAAAVDRHGNLDFCRLVEAEVEGAVATNYTYTPASDFYYAFGAHMDGLGGLTAANYVCKNTNTNAIVPCFDVSKAYPTDGTPFDEQPRDVALVAVIEMAYLKEQKEVPDFLEAIRQTRAYVDRCMARYDDGTISGLAAEPEDASGSLWVFASGQTYQFYSQSVTRVGSGSLAIDHLFWTSCTRNQSLVWTSTPLRPIVFSPTRPSCLRSSPSHTAAANNAHPLAKPCKHVGRATDPLAVLGCVGCARRRGTIVQVLAYG